MASGTRSKRRTDDPKAGHPALSSTDETSPTQKPKPGAPRTGLETILKMDSQSSPSDVSALPTTTTNPSSKRNKRKFHGEIDDDKRAAKRHVVDSPTLKIDEITSSTKEDSYEKVRYASLGNIVAEWFLKALAEKDVKARKADMQGLEMLEVDISDRQTAVRWKKAAEPQPSWLRLPDTAIIEYCSVFAVVASTKVSFERKAKDLFMSDIIGSRRLEASMVLVLQQSRAGSIESALVGCWMDGVFRYCDSLAAKTADMIAKELCGTKEPLSWYLEVPGKGSSRQGKMSGSSVRIIAENDADTESD